MGAVPMTQINLKNNFKNEWFEVSKNSSLSCGGVEPVPGPNMC